MSKLNKDRNLKLSVIKYFVENRFYPQMEVNVLSKQRISNDRKLVTDVDVYGLFPSIDGQLHIILADCKTLQGQSPAARMLWMRGLMDYLSANKGLIVLSRPIEKEHQMTASELDIQLLSDVEFATYAKHTTDNRLEIKSALVEGAAWDEYFDVSNRFIGLRDMQDFANTKFWNLENVIRLRNAIGILRKTRGEFNPANNLHVTVLLNFYSLVSIAVNEVLNRIFNRYLIPGSHGELDDDLKVIIWGGIDSYEYYNEIRKKVLDTPTTTGDLTLPEWPRFKELIRTALEHPREFNYVPLFLKELSFQFIGGATDYNLTQILVKENPFISVFSLKLCDYLTRCAGLPLEFQDIFEKVIFRSTP